MKKKNFILLIIIFFFAVLIRFFYIAKGDLTFSYDQARDAYMAKEIIGGHLKVLGPPTSYYGLFHGVIYYYVIAISYFVGSGNPAITAYWISLINAFSVFIVFYLGYLMTKKYWVGILSAVLYAVSFEAIQYSSWLSNPSLAFLSVPLMYLGLWLWTKERNKFGAILTGIGLGLSIQANIFLVYHIVPLVIWLLLNKKVVEKNSLVKFFGFLFLLLSSMIVGEIKFGFPSIKGVLTILSSQNSIVGPSGFADYIILYFNQLGRILSFNSYPGNIFFGASIVIGLLMYFFCKRKDNTDWPLFLCLWIFSHLTVISLGGTQTPYIGAGIGPAVSILLGITIFKLFESKKKIVAIIFTLFIIFSNLSLINKEKINGSVIFSIQKGMLLKNELSVIDYTYSKSNKEPFSINSITAPLWINIVWDYLYKWYGLPKYGYLPEWHGKDQIGQIAELPDTNKTTEKYFLIFESPEGIPQGFINQTFSEEDSVSTLLKEQKFGSITVQERQRKK